MSGSNGSALTPLAVGVSDSSDFSSWLGRPVQNGDETYVMVQASALIASGSQGLQLQTATSSGIGSYVVTLSTGNINLTCGAVPSTLTGEIAAGAYFLAVRDSQAHVMKVIGSLTGTVVVGEPLMASTGSALINVYTGGVTDATYFSGALNTSSGQGATLFSLTHQAAMALEAKTGIVAVTGWVKYRAPFRL